MIEINPAVKLQKGKSYPLIDIDKIIPGIRSVCSKELITYQGQSGCKFQNGDTLMARITPCLENGKIAQAKIDADAGIGSTELFVFRNRKDKTDGKWVYYFISSPYVRLSAINSMTGASGRQRADKFFIERLKFDFPDLPTQEKIASILSAYDDAIENNNKRIKILEKMAENLYREWFVRMRFPGHETAEYENGLPKGWSVKRMQEFCYVTDGTHDTPQPKTYGIPLVTGKSISNGFIDFSQTYNIAVKDHEAIQKRSGVVTGDIIFSNIGTIGNCCIVDYDREFSVKNAIIFKPNTWAVSVYLYYWLTSSSVKNLFLGQSNGASQQFVGLTYMRRMKIFIPSKHVIESFGKSTRPILEQRKILHRKNASLSYQRNKLLSRLLTVNQNYISGKIK